MNQLDGQDIEKDSTNQLDEQEQEQEIEKSSVVDKRTLILAISVPVVLLLSYVGYYFIKTNISDNNNTPQDNSYQNVLAEHLKVNNLNSQTKQSKHSNQIQQSKQMEPIKQNKQIKQEK